MKWIIILIAVSITLTSLILYLDPDPTPKSKINLTKIAMVGEKIPGSEQECINLEGLNRFTCYSGLSVNLVDPLFCDKAGESNPEMKAACLKYYRYELDPDYCSEINVTIDRHYCYAFRGGGRENTTICKTLPTGGLPRDICFTLAARISEDLEPCTFIHNKDMKTYCEASVTKNQLLCQKIEDDFREYKCKNCIQAGKCYFTSEKWKGEHRIW